MSGAWARLTVEGPSGRLPEQSPGGPFRAHLCAPWVTSAISCCTCAPEDGAPAPPAGPPRRRSRRLDLHEVNPATQRAPCVERRLICDTRSPPDARHLEHGDLPMRARSHSTAVRASDPTMRQPRWHHCVQPRGQAAGQGREPDHPCSEGARPDRERPELRAYPSSATPARRVTRSVTPNSATATRSASRSPNHSASSRVGNGSKSTASSTKRFNRRKTGFVLASRSVRAAWAIHAPPIARKLTRYAT